MSLSDSLQKINIVFIFVYNYWFCLMHNYICYFRTMFTYRIWCQSKQYLVKFLHFTSSCVFFESECIISNSRATPRSLGPAFGIPDNSTIAAVISSCKERSTGSLTLPHYTVNDPVSTIFFKSSSSQLTRCQRTFSTAHAFLRV